MTRLRISFHHRKILQYLTLVYWPRFLRPHSFAFLSPKVYIAFGRTSFRCNNRETGNVVFFFFHSFFILFARYSLPLWTVVNRVQQIDRNRNGFEFSRRIACSRVFPATTAQRERSSSNMDIELVWVHEIRYLRENFRVRRRVALINCNGCVALIAQRWNKHVITPER